MNPFSAWHATSPVPIFGFGLGGTGQLIPAITSVITDQLFVRFPKLKIVSVEAGCGYAPYLMDRLDAKFEALHQLTALPKRPSEYIRSNCYFVAEQGERTIYLALELVAACLIDPQFPEDELARERRATEDARRVRAADPGAIAFRMLEASAVPCPAMSNAVP